MLCCMYKHKHKDLSSIPRTHIKEASVVAHTCTCWGGGDGLWGAWRPAGRLRGVSEAQARELRGWPAPGPLRETRVVSRECR